MTTFALVHGGAHSSSCWQLLVPELEARGARCVSFDLPVDDPTATIQTYVDVAVEELAPIEGHVALVGHSQAGLTIPHVALRRPVSHLIFLCAAVPLPGRAHDSLTEPDRISPHITRAVRRGEDGVVTVDPELAVDAFYNTCPPDVATWAATTLLRRQARVDYLVPDAWPDVPTYYILGTEDHAIRPDWSRTTATGLFGVPAIEMETDHSPFLSAPRELADILVGIVQGDHPAGRGPAPLAPSPRRPSA